MSDKPSYLGLLNAIAIAEGRAHAYLCAWAETTPSADVRGVLLKIAAREGEHASSFARRINELGYEVRRKPDTDSPDGDRAIALVTSDCSDLDKMEALKLHRLDTGDKPDVFDDFFKDHTIDIATGELLGRYIAEERDTARLFRQCHAQLKAAESGAESGSDRLAALERKLDTLCSTVEDLCRALTTTAAAPNGTRAKAKAK